MTSYIKVSTKEANGINVILALTDSQDNTVESSEQVGDHEFLLGKVEKGAEYQVKLMFKGSLIQMSDFFHCPTLDLEVSMVPVDQIKSIEQPGCEEHHADDKYLTKLLFDELKNLQHGKKIIFNEPSKVFCYPASFSPPGDD